MVALYHTKTVFNRQQRHPQARRASGLMAESMSLRMAGRRLTVTHGDDLLGKESYRHCDERVNIGMNRWDGVARRRDCAAIPAETHQNRAGEKVASLCSLIAQK